MKSSDERDPSSAMESEAVDGNSSSSTGAVGNPRQQTLHYDSNSMQQQQQVEESDSEWVSLIQLGPFTVAEPMAPGSTTVIKCSAMKEDERRLVRFDPPGGLIFDHHNQTESDFINFFVLKGKVDPNNLPSVTCESSDDADLEKEVTTPVHESEASEAPGQQQVDKGGESLPEWIPGGQLGPFTVAEPVSPGSDTIIQCFAHRDHQAHLIRFNPPGGLVFAHHNQTESGFIQFEILNGKADPNKLPEISCTTLASDDGTRQTTSGSHPKGASERAHSSSSSSNSSNKYNNHNRYQSKPRAKAYRYPYGGRTSRMRRSWESDGGLNYSQLGFLLLLVSAGVYYLYTLHVVPRLAAARKSSNSKADYFASTKSNNDDDNADNYKNPQARRRNHQQRGGKGSFKAKHKSSGKKQGRATTAVGATPRSYSSAERGRKTEQQRSHSAATTNQEDSQADATVDTGATTEDNSDEIVGLNVGGSGSAHSCDVSSVLSVDGSELTAVRSLKHRQSKGKSQSQSNSSKLVDAVTIDEAARPAAGGDEQKPGVVMTVQSAAATAVAANNDECKIQTPVVKLSHSESASTEEERHSVEMSADDEKLKPVQTIPAEEKEDAKNISTDNEKLTIKRVKKVDEESNASERTMHEEVDTIDTSKLAINTTTDTCPVPESLPINKADAKKPPAIERAAANVEEVWAQKACPTSNDNSMTTSTDPASTTATAAHSFSSSAFSAPSMTTRKTQNIIVLQIEGMTCGGCVNMVNKVLNSFDEIDSAVTDLATCTSTLVCNVRRLNLLPILTALDDVGMEAYLQSQSLVVPPVPNETTNQIHDNDKGPSSIVAPPPGIPLPCPVLEHRMKQQTLGAIGRPLVASVVPIGSFSKSPNTLSLMDDLREGSTPLRRYACNCGSEGCICSAQQVHENDHGTEISLTDICNRLETSLGTTKLEETFRETGGSPELRDKIGQLSFPCGCFDENE